MQFVSHYNSPLGLITLSADHEGLTGLWLPGQPGEALLEAEQQHSEGGGNSNPVLGQAKDWLDAYFAGEKPEVNVPLHLVGTPFQLVIWHYLLGIPYGSTVTYGALARRYAAEHHKARMAAQAVGGAVGRNPLSIIVPCHRVVAKDGALTGYAGGIEKKAWLLEHEGFLKKSAGS